MLSLAAFSKVFDIYADNLPKTIEELKKSDKWGRISKKAGEVLSSNNWW